MIACEKWTTSTRLKFLSIDIKIRTFNAYVTSVFLYNSELWSVTKTFEKRIDSFQRRMLRQAINIRWPKKISSANLYAKTKQEAWSNIIKRRRLNWLGHMMRLDANTPVRKALDESLKPAKRNRGKPPTTWLKVVENDLKPLVNLELSKNTPFQTTQTLTQLTQDRNEWSSRIKDMMESNLCSE